MSCKRYFSCDLCGASIEQSGALYAIARFTLAQCMPQHMLKLSSNVIEIWRPCVQSAVKGGQHAG